MIYTIPLEKRQWRLYHGLPTNSFCIISDHDKDERYRGMVQKDMEGRYHIVYACIERRIAPRLWEHRGAMKHIQFYECDSLGATLYALFVLIVLVSVALTAYGVLL